MIAKDLTWLAGVTSCTACPAQWWRWVGWKQNFRNSYIMFSCTARRHYHCAQYSIICLITIKAHWRIGGYRTRRDLCGARRSAHIVCVRFLGVFKWVIPPKVIAVVFIGNVCVDQSYSWTNQRIIAGGIHVRKYLVAHFLIICHVIIE